jgi:hypothetical protein
MRGDEWVIARMREQAGQITPGRRENEEAQ